MAWEITYNSVDGRPLAAETVANEAAANARITAVTASGGLDYVEIRGEHIRKSLIAIIRKRDLDPPEE